MPAVKAVFSGQEVHTQAEGLTPPDTVVGTTAAVAIENCIVMHTQSSLDGGNEIERAHFVAHLAEVSGNVVIQWSRKSASSQAVDITVEWFVYEFEASSMEQDVQRGESDNTADPTDITITAVTIAQTMYLSSFKGIERSIPSGTQTGNVLSLFSTTVLRYDHVSAPASGECEVGWQVAEFKSADILASHGATTFQDSGTQAISGFTTLGNMFLLCTGHKGGNTNTNRSWSRGEIDSTSQISFDHNTRGSGADTDFSWSVFEFLDSGTVEKGEASMTDTETVPSTQPSFTALDENFAGVLHAWGGINNAYNPSTSDDGDVESSYCRISLDSGGAGLTITRGDSNAPFNIAWVAVEWAQAGGAAFMVPPPFIRQNEAIHRASRW